MVPELDTTITVENRFEVTKRNHVKRYTFSKAFETAARIETMDSELTQEEIEQGIRKEIIYTDDTYKILEFQRIVYGIVSHYWNTQEDITQLEEGDIVTVNDRIEYSGQVLTYGVYIYTNNQLQKYPDVFTDIRTFRTITDETGDIHHEYIVRRHTDAIEN